MDKLRALLDYVREPEIATTLVGSIIAAILAYSGIKNQDIPQSLTAILTILGTLAIAQTITGYQSSKFRKSIERIERHLQSSRAFFTNRDGLNSDESLQQYLARGQDILIIGTSLVGTIGPLRTFLRTLVQQGTRLRFLLLDPESAYLEFAARSHGVPVNSLKNDINAALSHLGWLVESVRDRRNSPIQFRLLKTLPGASMIIRDGGKNTGEIRYELYLYQTDTTERPAFRLTPADGEVYRNFCDAAERLWNDSQE